MWLYNCRFFSEESNLSALKTVGVINYAKSFQLSDGSIINCLIYDTGGQEQYKSINESYFKSADAILLVYDISNKKSFDEIQNYYVEKIRESCKVNIPILLLGNKTDLEEYREVPRELGIKLAEKENYGFTESSCLKNHNVAGAFETLVERWNFENLNKQDKIKKEKKNEKKTPRKLTRAITEFNLERNFLEGDFTPDNEPEEERPNSFTFQLSKTKKKNEKEKKCCH